MTGTYIDIAAREGSPIRAYVTRPAQGSGPGIVLLHDAAGLDDFTQSTADRFAEEGYVVLAPDLSRRAPTGGGVSMENLAAVLDALRALPEHAGRVGAVGFGAGGRLAVQAAANADIDCAVAYYPDDLAACHDDLRTIRCPMVFHFPEQQSSEAFVGHAQIQRYIYSGCAPGFAAPARHADSRYDKPAALMAYSRTLGLLRDVMGPVYDLDRLWEQHCYFEFATRDVDAVMPTMVAEPYVNHVPTMTGGVGYDELKRFYTYHFVHANPQDTKLIPVSRTIGADRIVDEFVFCATHDREIDWLLPGLAPTGRYFEVPMLAVVRFRGDKLYNEHIYWDQASVLVQIGVLDPTGLPVAGRETARKMLDETLPSNTLMRNWASSEGKPV
ncbi:dienelactone hydrolase family protein [Caballeronia sp. LZ062]|uniref:dienelactone hydrolase family protein n=1 Tax=unclassified Caballeronia TaxID=2646786 RepID=UPI00285C1ACB|nr:MULTISPECIES: dienelactone hydrolase family protein [unclassified Caballeronia]MDR5856344.1 dienelactone hydrolase family protein [Caballeronia sp. LZ050]MDR5873014.1 dienelactone hydrolase family protein [Caballeronia sp. LZ062]